MSSKWQLVAVLPNLRVVDPIENEFLALVSPDEALARPLESEPAVRVLLTNFTDAFKRPVSPSALLARVDAPDAIRGDAVVAFRNSLALPMIVSGWSSVVRGGQLHPPLWADTFAFYPITARKDGHLGASTPAIGMIDTTDDFVGQSSPLLAQMDATRGFDRDVFERIAAQWRSIYVDGTRDPQASRLFRSLQTAFTACTVPYDNFASLGDFGVRLGLWASAFEILAHPGSGQVNARVVASLLNRYDSLSEGLNERQTVRYGDSDMELNAVARLYLQMSRARNAFVHGNPLPENIIYVAHESSNHAWNVVAPLLYWCALRTHLGISPRRETTAEILRDEMIRIPLDEALRVALGPRRD